MTLYTTLSIKTDESAKNHKIYEQLEPWKQDGLNKASSWYETLFVWRRARYNSNTMIGYIKKQYIISGQQQHLNCFQRDCKMWSQWHDKYLFFTKLEWIDYVVVSSTAF